MKKSKLRVYLVLFVVCLFAISVLIPKLYQANAATAKPSWKIDTSPYTINWYVNYDWYTKKWDAKNCLLDKYITQETGISINFTVGNDDKFNAMLAAGQLPEVITCDKYASQKYELEESGLLWSLDDLSKKYAPNLYKDLPASMRKLHGSEKDGKLYGLINYFYAPEQVKPGMEKEVAQIVHNELKARKDIMDKLGIKPSDFNTKSSTLAVLRKVRDANIVFNGFKMIPAFYTYANLVEFFATPREDSKGNYVYMNHTKEALECFKFMNQLYREKLLPVESLTLNDEQIRQKIARGEVFSITGHNYDQTTTLINALYNIDKKAYFVHVGPLKGDSGKSPTLRPSPSDGWTITMITKKAKKPERLIRLFEFLYDVPENQISTQLGPYGAAWTWDKDKKHFQYTSQYLSDYEKDASKASTKYIGGSRFEWFANWLVIGKAWPIPQEIQLKENYGSDSYFSQWMYNDLPFANIDPHAGTDLAAIRQKVDDLLDEYTAYMVKAKSEKDVEKYFNEMIAKQKQAGFDKLYKYWDQQFKKNKQKFGIKKAWPLKYGSFNQYLK